MVYSIPCRTDDNKVYTGQTKRMLEVKIAEHRNDCRKRNPKSGLAVRTIEKEHVFGFEKLFFLTDYSTRRSDA